jgi:hypothetical protein
MNVNSCECQRVTEICGELCGWEFYNFNSSCEFCFVLFFKHVIYWRC